MALLRVKSVRECLAFNRSSGREWQTFAHGEWAVRQRYDGEKASMWQKVSGQRSDENEDKIR